MRERERGRERCNDKWQTPIECENERTIFDLALACGNMWRIRDVCSKLPFVLATFATAMKSLLLVS